MMTTLIKILIAIVGCCYAWLLLTAHHPVLNPINPPLKASQIYFLKRKQGNHSAMLAIII